VADWAKTNFGEVKDTSPAGVAIEWRFARPQLGGGELGVSWLTYQPETRFPFAHRHREQEEAYVVVGGSGRVKLDDEILELKQWDVVRVSPQVEVVVCSGAITASGRRFTKTSRFTTVVARSRFHWRQSSPRPCHQRGCRSTTTRLTLVTYAGFARYHGS